jgi:hypothetical protein
MRSKAEAEAFLNADRSKQQFQNPALQNNNIYIATQMLAQYIIFHCNYVYRFIA